MGSVLRFDSVYREVYNTSALRQIAATAPAHVRAPTHCGRLGHILFEDTSVMVRFFSTLSGSSAVHWDFTVESAVFDRFWLWITAIVFCMPVRKWAENLHSSLFEESSVLGATLSVSTKIIIAVVILVVSVAMLVGATNNAFLYTRF